MWAWDGAVAHGQCPVAACTPGNGATANAPFDMGIYRVQLAGLDTATAGATEDYRDVGYWPGTILQREATYT